MHFILLCTLLILAYFKKLADIHLFPYAPIPRPRKFKQLFKSFFCDTVHSCYGKKILAVQI